MKRGLLSFLAMSTLAGAQEDFEPFDLTELPPGVMVTLPHPAHSSAPVGIELRVQASDRAQVLKMNTLALRGGTKKVRLAIYDQESSAVQHLTLEPGSPFLYHFKSMKPIRIVPEMSPQAFKSQKLLLESNKPLGISHLSNADGK